MQLTPVSSVGAPPAPSAAASAPARERVRPLLAPDVRDAIPDAILDARIGRGTVASEFDRAIRVRFEGDGPASGRTLVPETTTAQRLLASKAGPAFERLVRHTAGTADATRGEMDLRSFTFVPDEHAAKAVELLGYVAYRARKMELPPGVQAQLSEEGTPDAERAAARELAADVAAEVPAQQRFRAGVNAMGDITIAPDVSRQLLATIGAYRPGKGDPVLEPPATVREEIVREDFDTLVHETHHSITPQYAVRESEITAIFEEAIPSVFARRDRSQVARRAGADIAGLAKDPTQVRDDAKLGWKPWNREHLPAPPADKVATATGRYVDGPAVLRRLLGVAGIDMRTTAGKERAFEILQGRAAAHAPRRLADAIIDRHGIAREHREDVVNRVRTSVQHERGAKLVTDLLAELNGRPTS